MVQFWVDLDHEFSEAASEEHEDFFILVRDGRVQACACANDSKEQQKEDGAPPIVATDSIMITATINAHEWRNVATIDIPGAFLNAYKDKETFMLLRGRLTELMVQVDPKLCRKLSTIKTTKLS